jgi:uncharacterized protein (DUF2235 family)
MTGSQGDASDRPTEPEPVNSERAVEPDVSPQSPYAPRKRIVLLSDGTGNSSGKLFKTNVWRFYQALDLGPGGAHTVQIANYNDGVGTSSFKPLAILGGVFGYGLKRNVLHMYRYLCRNYSPQDEIFALGFSRGAFTIRLLVALIGSQGIVPYTDERDLARQSADAYREFCRANRANVLPWGTTALRWLRDIALWLLRIGKAPYRPGVPGTPVRFVGVWDTVAAYGGPIIEITRAIDDWLWPMTMTDYRLGDHVITARHALALDDERDAFQPLLWDEFHEHRRAKAIPDAEARQVAQDRLQQVWFAGMHADVGGGYPDDSLAHVSLDWMLDHAAAAGLTFLNVESERIAAAANSFGPIHDSRQGVGVYYRYQPRKIEALLHVGSVAQPGGAPGARPLSETLILRDPRVGEKPERPRGLLMSCSIHESVISRIAAGTDNYAPITLPRCFNVAPPPPARNSTRPRLPLVDQAALSALSAVAEARSERQEVIWNWVWARRITYFATLALTLSLAFMPWWQPLVQPIPPSTDGRWVLGSIIGWLHFVLPGFAALWVEAFAAGSIYFLGICIAIAVLIAIATKQEQTLRDRTRELWWAAIDTAWPTDRPLPGSPSSRLRNFRTSRYYQAALQFLKWRLLPSLLGPAMILTLLYGAAVILTQARLTVQERGTDFCPGPQQPSAVRPDANFQTDIPCNPVPVTHPPSPAGAEPVYTDPVARSSLIEEGRRYQITMDVAGPWCDGDTPADPTGLHPVSIRQRLPQLLGWPFRRIVTADAMVPLIEIRSEVEGTDRLPEVRIDALTMEPVGPQRPLPSCEHRSTPLLGKPEVRRYRAIYTAGRSGHAYLFANEAIFPDMLVPDAVLNARPDWFYTSPRRGNQGEAKVTIEPIGD